MAGAFHGVGEADRCINVGVSGPGVVKRALEEVRGADFETVCETVKRTAFKITRVGQLIAKEAAKRLDTPFGTDPCGWGQHCGNLPGNGSGGSRRTRHNGSTGTSE